MSESSVTSPPPHTQSWATRHGLGKTIERSLVELQVVYWARCKAKTEDAMHKLKSHNEQIQHLNLVLSLVGQLNAKVTDSGDAQKLRDALDVSPELIWQINTAIKNAKFSEPPFDAEKTGKTDLQPTSKPGPGFSQEYTKLSELALACSLSAIEEAGQGNEGMLYLLLLKLGNTFLGDFPDDLGGLLANDKKELKRVAQLMIPQKVPYDLPVTADAVNEENNWIEFNKNYLIFFEGEQWIRNHSIGLFAKINRLYTEKMTKKLEGLVFGGLSREHDGPSLFRAIKTVQMEITKATNDLQTDTMLTNARFQETSAAVSGIKDAIEKMFGSLEKILSR